LTACFGQQFVDCGSVINVQECIHTGLIEWWLADMDFILNQECHVKEATLLFLNCKKKLTRSKTVYFWLMVDTTEAVITVL
jgi:hypothetical protein